ncbi:HNH endonuclease [Bacillus sp. MRMR6]|uniref:HNH endonuclease n=1 Tax=Bacillus sp. MRMR6 TaxID=1928617 RepID=UPI000952EACA|nr:HNH endonuclease [Bacillus sp. MRMR6]OLS40786.1 HNH endonuclease [Bacillus sp. MRMR6]
MDNILDLYKQELNDPSRGYFIFDTKGTAKDHDDVDFVSYNWSPSKFNRVKEGDLFLYRRPSSASEINGKFYFFGAGKIESIEFIGEDRVKGIIRKPIAFTPVLLPNDVEDFRWTFKERGKNWGYFFNQYGMTTITKEDFMGIVQEAFAQRMDAFPTTKAELLSEVETIQELQRQHYFVDDHFGQQKKRVGQPVFSEQVKKNYGYACAITKIQTKSFLIGSHIIPWSERKDTRLDPQNGICLSVLLDKAFDKGYITITPDYFIKVSTKINDDPALAAELSKYHLQKMKVPKYQPPKREYLEWHNEVVFKG